MTDAPPILLWLRRDFRLSDHPALAEAAGSGRPVIPVFVLDEVAETFGAAPKWRLGEAMACFGARLETLGSRLVLRRGLAAEALLALAKETGARDIWWTRAYDPDAIARDKAAKAALKTAGLAPRSFAGNVLFEPWTVTTKQGGFFKVYSPLWRAVRDLDVALPLPAPKRLLPPPVWPRSDAVESWELAKAMNRGASVVARYARIGEERAQDRLSRFVQTAIEAYRARRDVPGEDATSRLSEPLAWGEIGPRTIWHAGQRAMQDGAAGAEHFLKELVWREFATHLAYHTPHITGANWRPEWDAFGWSTDESAAVLRWKQGRTGVPLVDAAMRELYVTGTMHNRGRMIVASYLTKHMLTHWKIGLKWFEECLIDWDPASNAMGWQWVAGAGPDAAPYFRIFNPDLQAERFDPNRTYVERFVAELSPAPGPDARAFFEACPREWALSADKGYPTQPVVGLAEGRKAALAAYSALG